MAKFDLSTKHVAISKTNARMVAIVGVASFITVFCLVAAQAVWSQTRYQARVTSTDETAHQQLLKNIQTFNNLVSSYQAFNSTANNVIGGLTSGTSDNDGDNSKIILDALPDSYDFPALTASVEKILTDRNFTIGSITGTDDQLAEQSNTSSPNPQPVSIPFSFSVTNANYTSVQQLITALQQSIRPIQIDSMTLSGGTTDMTLTVNAHTYYQPAKNLGITQKVVK
jgi:hypothetical protein